MQTKLNKTAVVWSQPNCQACYTAKITLVNSGYTVEERIVTEGGLWTKADLLAAVPGARTVPQIFIDGKHIGDFKDLRTFLSEK